MRALRNRSHAPRVLAGLGFLVGLGLGAGCKGDVQATRTAAAQADAGGMPTKLPPGARPIPFADQIKCTTDADCVRAKGDCCGCGGDGFGVAINKNQKAAFEKRLESTCAETACVTLMSRDPSCFLPPVCSQGECTLGRRRPREPPTTGPFRYTGPVGPDGKPVADAGAARDAGAAPPPPR